MPKVLLPLLSGNRVEFTRKRVGPKVLNRTFWTPNRTTWIVRERLNAAMAVGMVGSQTSLKVLTDAGKNANSEPGTQR